jgi:arylsulfatase A-like enzyme
LAKNGLIFNNAYLTTSSCSPSRNSILTGRYPHNTGAAELHTEPPLDMTSFPEILKDKGYYTLQAGKFHMGEYAKRGFHEVHDNKQINGLGGEDYWVEGLKKRPESKPFFMWFASYDAHRIWGENEFSGTHNPDKIVVPDYLVNGSLTRLDLANYYDEITRFDHYIGEVVNELKAQGEYENTYIIVMADNGRPFPHSKTRLNDQGVKTPFIVHHPRSIMSNKKSNSLISAVDIASTILDIAGITPSESFQGNSFLNIINNPELKFRNYVFAEHNWHDYESYQRMVRNEKYLYIKNSRPQFPQEGPLDAINSPTYIDLKDAEKNKTISKVQAEIFIKPRPSEELYDLSNDPFQYKNLLEEGDIPQDYELLKKILNQWINDTGDTFPEKLTKDWYLREQEKFNESSLLKTQFHGVRGEMPGSSTLATKNNNKGPF